MKATLAHKIRLRPTVAQERYFRRACGVARFTYNYALAEWKSAYAAGEKPSGRGLKVRFNAIRREHFPWSFEVHRDCTARPFDNLQGAFRAFFRGDARYPAFKKRGLRAKRGRPQRLWRSRLWRRDISVAKP